MMTPEDSQWLCRELGYVLSAAAEDFKASRPSLRDQFAMMAMQGMMANGDHGCPNAIIIAGTAYDIADAMLAAREWKPTQTAKSSPSDDAQPEPRACVCACHSKHNLDACFECCASQPEPPSGEAWRPKVGDPVRDKIEGKTWRFVRISTDTDFSHAFPAICERDGLHKRAFRWSELEPAPDAPPQGVKP